MQFAEVRDYGDVCDTLVTNIASIERISPGQVRITYYQRTRDGKNRLVTSHIWDAVQWVEAHKFFSEHRSEILETVLAEVPEPPVVAMLVHH